MISIYGKHLWKLTKSKPVQPLTIIISIALAVVVFVTALFYQSVMLQGSVTSIGQYAFSGCNNLQNVYYKGTVAQWDSITIDSDNTPLINARRYYYSESEPVLNTEGTAYNGYYWRYIEGVVTVWEF